MARCSSVSARSLSRASRTSPRTEAREGVAPGRRSRTHTRWSPREEGRGPCQVAGVSSIRSVGKPRAEELRDLPLRVESVVEGSEKGIPLAKACFGAPFRSPEAPEELPRL